MFNKILLTFSCLFCLIFKVDAQLVSQQLTTNWVFQEQDEAKWYPAKVPGEVHVDLLTNKLIPDLFIAITKRKYNG